MVPDIFIPDALIELVNQFYLRNLMRTVNPYRTFRFFCRYLPLLLSRPDLLLPYLKFFRSWCDVKKAILTHVPQSFLEPRLTKAEVSVYLKDSANFKRSQNCFIVVNLRFLIKSVSSLSFRRLRYNLLNVCPVPLSNCIH